MPWSWPLGPQPNQALWGEHQSPTPDIFNFIGWDFGTHPIIIHLRTRTEGKIQPSTANQVGNRKKGIVLGNTVHCSKGEALPYKSSSSILIACFGCC